MSQTCPTVAIKTEPSDGNPSGVVVINESDFDKATMTMCDAPVPEAPQAPQTPAVDPVDAPVPEAPQAPQTPAVDPVDAEVPKVVAPWAAK